MGTHLDLGDAWGVAGASVTCAPVTGVAPNASSTTSPPEGCATSATPPEVSPGCRVLLGVEGKVVVVVVLVMGVVWVWWWWWRCGISVSATFGVCVVLLCHGAPGPWGCLGSFSVGKATHCKHRSYHSDGET